MRVIRHVWILFLVGALGACASPPVPKEQYFRLIAAAPQTTFAHPFDGPIQVSPFAAEGVLAERPLLFTANEGRKLEQRNYAYWTDAPPQMLRDQVIAYLQTAGVAPDVVPTELRIAAKYQIKGVLRRLEQEIGTSPGAMISIDLSLIEQDTDRLIFSQNYSAKKSTPDESIDAAADALNSGLNDILAAFLADLAKAR